MSMPPPGTPVSIPVSRSRPWSPEEIRALGVTTDLLTAASVLRIGRTKAYHLARAGEFPVPVVRTGRRYLVAVTHLLHMLGMDTTAPASWRLALCVNQSVHKRCPPADSTEGANPDERAHIQTVRLH